MVQSPRSRARCLGSHPWGRPEFCRQEVLMPYDLSSLLAVGISSRALLDMAQKGLFV